MTEDKSVSRNIHRGSWSSGLGFLLAAIGSAIGLGNVWRFPYITGQYGGGAFVLVYIGCVMVVGVPILLACDPPSASFSLALKEADRVSCFERG